MAKTPTPQTYDPNKLYDVKVKRAVELHPRVWARPNSTEVRVTGDVLNRIVDDIESAIEVEPQG